MTAPTSDDPRLDREQLVRFFTDAIRPDPGTHLVGTELEKFGVISGRDGLEPVGYTEHVGPVLEAMVERFGWEPGPARGTDGEVVELRRRGASITLEPGGQFELSGAPLRNVHETCAEFTEHFRELDEVSTPLGVSWLAAGFHPFATRERIRRMPKGRYAVMTGYLPTRGSKALDMMLRTCTVQANFDYGSEAEADRRYRLAVRAGPVVTALFANSPYIEGVGTGLPSNRTQVWLDTDPDRCGTPAFIREGHALTFERYVDWVLDVPMFFIVRDGRYLATHVPFREYLKRGLEVDGTVHRATWDDWTLHLSTVFPEVRLKPHIEVRHADAVGSRWVCALPALWKGLLYDDGACEEALDRLSRMDRDTFEAFELRARTTGLADPEVGDTAAWLVELARDALTRANIADSRGRTEARFLDALDEVVASRRSPGASVAEELGQRPATDALCQAFYCAGAPLASDP